MPPPAGGQAPVSHGRGHPWNIIIAVGVYRGVDFFDRVMPARNARHVLFTWKGVINIVKNEKYKLMTSPRSRLPVPHLPEIHSRAYLRHPFKAEVRC